MEVLRRCSVYLIAVFGMLLSAIRVDAAEWYVRGNLIQQVNYDDNFSLEARSDDANSELESDSTVALNMGGRTPDLEVQLNSVFDYAYFPETSSLNSADQAFNLNTTYQLERATVGLGADFVRDTTRTSDVDDTGLFIEQNKRRELYRVGPTWTYQLTPLDTISAYGSYTSVSFHTKDLDSYSEAAGGADWSRQLTARTQLQARLYGLHSESGAGGDEKSDVISLELGGTHDFSERWQATLLVGPRYAWTDETVRSGPLSMRERNSERDDSAGYVLNANVRYRAGERTNIFAVASRGVDPGSTTGVIEERTEFGLFLNHQLLQRVAINLSGTYSIQESVGDTQSAGDSGGARRDFATFSPGVSWRLSENLFLDCSYSFRWQHEDQGRGTATSNAVFATLTYRLPQLSISR